MIKDTLKNISVYRIAAITDWYVSPDAAFASCAFVNTDGVRLHIHASAKASRRFLGGLYSLKPQISAWAERHPDAVKTYQPPQITREVSQPMMMSGSPHVFWEEDFGEIVAMAPRTNMEPFMLRGSVPMIISVWDQLSKIERQFAKIYEQSDASIVSVFGPSS